MKIKYIGELWADIKGYVGLYQVSNFGRVRSVDRWVNHAYGKALKKGKIVKPWINNKGYYVIGLCKNSVVKKMFVHRLVAEAFIPNPKHYPCVNHKDCNPANCKLSNLEWCTTWYNTHYGDCQEKQRKAKLGKINNKLSVAVIQYDLNSNVINEWVSIAEINRQLNYNTSAICMCCKGKQKIAYGYIWKYKRDVAV